jgi:hypothetical protein
MPRWADRWIVVVNWTKFQPRRERPGAPWIKVHLQALRKPEWIDLSLADQGLWLRVLLYYADGDGRLRVADVIRWIEIEDQVRITKSLQVARSERIANAQKRHHERITRGLDRLNRAGFIGFSDDKPLPLSLSSTEVDARARENGGPPEDRPAPCPECEVGGGYHAAGCSRAEVRR